MQNRRNMFAVFSFVISVLLVIVGGSILFMHFANKSEVKQLKKSKSTTPTTVVTSTPTPVLDLSENSDGNAHQDLPDNNTQTQANQDTNFIAGKQTLSLDGKTYKLSEDAHSIVYEEGGETKQLYTTDGLLKKFNIAGNYIFLIERHPTETNHYYFKRILIGSGKTTVLWHYISGYTMEDFLISPTTFATNKLYYILFTGTKQILVLKIKDYKLVAQKSQNIEYTAIEKWYKLKDQDAVTIVFKQNGQTQTLQINFE